MERLLEKNQNEYLVKHKEFGSQALLDMFQTGMELKAIIQKLGPLEDIEEEFGIDLVKLLSAKKVYYMAWNHDYSGFIIKETYKLFINLTDRRIEYYDNGYSEVTFDLALQDYGKKDVYGGWAFTREELL